MLRQTTHPSFKPLKPTKSIQLQTSRLRLAEPPVEAGVEAAVEASVRVPRFEPEPLEAVAGSGPELRQQRAMPPLLRQEKGP